VKALTSVSSSVLGESRLQLGQGLEGGSSSDSIVGVDNDGVGLPGLGIDLLDLRRESEGSESRSGDQQRGLFDLEQQGWREKTHSDRNDLGLESALLLSVSSLLERASSESILDLSGDSELLGDVLIPAESKRRKGKTKVSVELVPSSSFSFLLSFETHLRSDSHGDEDILGLLNGEDVLGHLGREDSGCRRRREGGGDGRKVSSSLS